MNILLYLVTVGNLLAMMFLSLPFFAQSVQDFSPGLYMNIYVQPSLVVMIGICGLFAIPISSVLTKYNVTAKRKIRSLSALLVLFISLGLILYFNLNELSELMNRPTYE